MIDKVSGQVEYAVMSTGGFLGIGESYSPVPWDSLVYDVNLGGYVIESIENFAHNVAFLQSGSTLDQLAGRYPSGEDGREATRIAEAVHRSIETGSVVNL